MKARESLRDNIHEKSNLINSDVENTLILDCFLNTFSSDTNNYIKVVEKNKGAKNVTPTVRNSSLDFNNYNNDKYINLSEEKIKDANNVASKVMHKVLTKLNNDNDNNYINLSAEKNKKGSNGVEPNRLTPDCNNCNGQKYLNISVGLGDGCAEMAEWLTQSINTRYPSGCVGSIPTLGATNFADANGEVTNSFSQLDLSVNSLDGEIACADAPEIDNVINEETQDDSDCSDNGCLLVNNLINIEPDKASKVGWLSVFNSKNIFFETTGNHPYLVKINETDYEDSSDSCSEICLVEIPTFILNNNGSYVHNKISFDKQSATKSSSLMCFPSNSFAFGINFLYLSNGTNSTLLNINEDNILNSSSESLDFDRISFLLLKNSCLSFNGADKCKLSSKISSRISPWEINILNSTLASSTTSIYISSSDLSCECMDALTLFDSSSASLSVNLDLETMSLATESSNSLTKDCINLARTNSNLSLNSEGTSTLTLISAINENSKGEYLNVSNSKNIFFDKIISVRVK